jgi:Pyruvate/2-oxoacid:ferredoxin oxidoreductase delta subunit
MSRLKSWKELPPGGLILEAGNARTYKTGDWRTERPQVDKAKCINCFFCWAYCPDASVIVDADRALITTTARAVASVQAFAPSRRSP